MITNNKFYLTKRFVAFGLCLICNTMMLSAQTVRADYFLKNSQTRSSMNPAFRPDQGYVGFPFLSDMGITVYTNFLNLDHLVFERNGERVTFLHPSVSSTDFLSNLPEQNNFDMDLHYKFLTLGWYNKKKGFWTFDAGIRNITSVKIPRSLFELLKVGFDQDENKPVGYSIQNLKVLETAYMEFGVGYSGSLLDDQLLVGAKVKILAGLANMELSIDQLDISTGNGEWIAGSRATLAGSMKGIRPEYNDKNQFKSIKPGGAGFSGIGTGLDIGGAYKFLDKRAQVSMAFTDIGVIFWQKDNSMYLKTPETEVRISPDQLNLEKGNLSDQIQTITDDLRETINFKESEKSGRSTALRTNMNIGLAYEVWKKNMSVGLLSSTYMGYGNTLSELTLSANYNPDKIRWLSAAMSYSFLNNLNALGLALHLAPSQGFSLFVGSDFLLPHVNKDFFPTSSKAINFQVGIAVPMGKKRGL